MNRTLLILVCLWLFNSACSSLPSSLGKHPRRGVSSSEQGGLDILAESNLVIDMVNTRELNGENCERELSGLISDYQLLSPQNLDLAAVKADGQKILDSSFKARLALHSLIETFPVGCKIKLKELNLLIRIAEDYVGVHYYNDEQISSSSIKFEDQPTPIFEAAAYHPYQVGKNINPNEKFVFQNGDIMVTKGVSFISSTISEIAHPRSLFSHIVFVHVDRETKEVTTLESYVGKGVGIYPIEEALKNENARILVLRPKNRELASKAADYMYNRVLYLKNGKKYIPYDYDLDFSDNSKLSCEEVAYDAFKNASDGKVILPEMMSQITMEDKNFLQRIGLKKGMMMIPSDMETDSRFDIVLDWTDYRLMRDSWRKDAVLGEMFRWIEEHNYKIHENMTSMAAKLIWSTRYVPGLWSLGSKISGIPRDFTKDVPSKAISTMASLKIIGDILLPEMIKADVDYYQKTRKWMSTEMLRDSLERFRETNPKNLRKVFRER